MRFYAGFGGYWESVFWVLGVGVLGIGSRCFDRYLPIISSKCVAGIRIRLLRAYAAQNRAVARILIPAGVRRQPRICLTISTVSPAGAVAFGFSFGTKYPASRNMLQRRRYRTPAALVSPVLSTGSPASSSTFHHDTNAIGPPPPWSPVAGNLDYRPRRPLPAVGPQIGRLPAPRRAFENSPHGRRSK